MYTSVEVQMLKPNLVLILVKSISNMFHNKCVIDRLYSKISRNVFH